MKYLFGILFISILLFACNKDPEPPCETCFCFDFADPVRLLYFDSDDNDLLTNGEVIIDSLTGYPIVDFEISKERIPLEYIITNQIAGVELDNAFIDLKSNFITLLPYPSEIIPGLNENHEFYIHRNNSIIDTIEIKWNIVITPIDECCSCTHFPEEYRLHNGKPIQDVIWI